MTRSHGWKAAGKSRPRCMVKRRELLTERKQGLVLRCFIKFSHWPLLLDQDICGVRWKAFERLFAYYTRYVPGQVTRREHREKGKNMWKKCHEWNSTHLMHEITFPMNTKRVCLIDTKPGPRRGGNGAMYTLLAKAKICPLAISVCYEC